MHKRLLLHEESAICHIMEREYLGSIGIRRAPIQCEDIYLDGQELGYNPGFSILFLSKAEWPVNRRIVTSSALPDMLGADIYLTIDSKTLSWLRVEGINLHSIPLESYRQFHRLIYEKLEYAIHDIFDMPGNPSDRLYSLAALECWDVLRIFRICGRLFFYCQSGSPEIRRDLNHIGHVSLNGLSCYASMRGEICAIDGFADISTAGL